MYKRTLSIILIVTAGLSLSACSMPTGSPDPGNVTTPTPEPAPVWTPTFVEVATLEGQEINIKKGEFIEIGTFRSDSPNAWLISTDNPEVVKVGSGSPSNFAAPIVEGITEGSATVTLNNAATNDVVVFSVKVSK